MSTCPAVTPYVESALEPQPILPQRESCGCHAREEERKVGVRTSICIITKNKIERGSSSVVKGDFKRGACSDTVEFTNIIK